MDTLIKVDSVSDLIDAANEPDIWIIEGLIEEGDQVVLCGAPKAGKSLMASQIALAVASGGNFLGWRAPIARKVLYVNLELRCKRFGRRLIAQGGDVKQLIKYSNLKTINCLRTLDIRDPKQCEAFAKEVKELEVDLVIWDVLARMHGADENDNPSMRAVMHSIRVASADKAHMIIHHMRKAAAGQENVNLGAAGMRGASSIHGEADLIMSLHVRSGQGARFSVKFSARNIETPEELLLDRDTKLRFHEASDEKMQRLRAVIESAFGIEPICRAKELIHHLMTNFSVQKRSAQYYIETAIEKGWIIDDSSHEDKRYEYKLLNSIISEDTKPNEGARVQ
ncbi:AAA family ATPase [Methylotenera versatilis]|uniref:AAA ATPase n=1 Tax=Methylotenera versatilis (strain 301) TaxID=666681 RepID=D7DJD8_METV0|nr:AAA family ATPase [Methylotenera versatilis]ADI30173.1 hypothetical protein M301_1796 [Methylotenera versatilis 301]